jgi:hypothetical protein
MPRGWHICNRRSVEVSPTVVRHASLVVALVGCTAPAHSDPRPPIVGVLLPWPNLAPPTGPFFIANPVTKVVPILRDDAPNLRYANLDRTSCLADLAKRDVPFASAETIAGVDTPVRLRGPLHGVTFSSDRKHDVLDCRLVLALDDFAQQLAARDVTAVRYFDAYRSKTDSGCTRKYWGLQHCAALAIDIHAFEHRDGSMLNVDRDFHGHIGLATCVGGVVPSPTTKAATELWSLVCGAADAALFNVVLTPNFNAEHRNHFHLELTPDAGWMMVH